MRKLRRRIAQILTGAGAGIIAASTIAPAAIAGAAEVDNRLIAHIGETVEVESGDINEYVIGEDKVEYAQKSIGEEDVYAVSYSDAAPTIKEKNISIEDGEVVGNTEDEEEAETALVKGDGLIDAEEETTIAAAIKSLEAAGEDITYADVQSIVWTVETDTEVFPVNTINTEALEKIYASIEDGSVLEAISEFDVTSVGAQSDKNDYVIFYYTPQVTEVKETVTPVEVETKEATTPVVEVETEGTIVKEIAETVEQVKEEVEEKEEKQEAVEKLAIENSGTTEISDTVDVELEKKVEEDKEKKAELKETGYLLPVHFLVIDSNSAAKTIDGVYADSPDDVLIQHSGEISLYDTEDGYLTGFVNAADMNEHFSDIIDIQVGLNDVSGTLVEGASFDGDTIKIPSKYFTEAQYNNVGTKLDVTQEPVKAQFMVKYDDSENTESTVNIEIENNTDFEVNDIKSIKANDNDVSFNIPLASPDTDLSLDNIDVYLDNSEIAENKGLVGVTYKDGVLTIPQSSILINNVKVVISDNSIKNIANVYTDEFNGIKVTAEAEVGAFPAGTTMVLGEVAETSVDEIVDTVESNAAINVTDKKAVDISFELNGEEIEPAEGKSVNIKLDFADELVGEQYAVIHKHDDNINLLSTNIDEESAEFVVDEFSEFVMIAADGSNIDAIATLKNVNKDVIESFGINKWITLPDASANIAYNNLAWFQSNDPWAQAHMKNANYLYGTNGGRAFASSVMVGLAENIPLGLYDLNTADSSTKDEGGATVYKGAYDANPASDALGGRPDYVIPYSWWLGGVIVNTGIIDRAPIEGSSAGDWVKNNMGNYYPTGAAQDDETAQYAPLYCSHTSATGLPYNDLDDLQAYNVTYRMKVLAYEPNASTPYVVMGFVTGEIGQKSQEAVAIYRFNLEFKPQNGYVKIIKKSAAPAAVEGGTDGQHYEGYSLEGAEFKVYRDEGCTDEVGTMTTNDKGEVTSGELKAGTYWVKETKAPAGHKPVEGAKSVTVNPNETATVEFTDPIETPTFKIHKSSSDPSVTNGNDCYSLAGAEYGIYNTRAKADQDIDRLATLVTDASGNTNVHEGLWMGTYYVKELKAPKGYVLDDEVKEVKVTQDTTFEVQDEPGKDPTLLKVIKADDSGNAMPGVTLAGAEFEVKYYTNSKWEGEANKTWTITTNNNGIAALSEELAAGTYTVQEKKAPAGYKIDNTLYKGSIEVIDDGSGRVEINDALQGKAAINAKDDNVFEIKNTRNPEVSTSATDKNTGVRSGVVGNTTITDTVTYKNLYEGKKYTMKGTLMDKATGQPLIINGKTFVVEKPFTPSAPNGTVTLDFDVPTTSLAGKSTVVFEELIPSEDVPSAEHKDINDKKQEVKFPSVGTKAIDKNSTIQAGVNGKTTYVDTVSYTNLDVGSNYKVTGVLMDKETGRELQIAGKTVTGSKNFTPSSENGTVQVEFTIDASSLAGKSVVVFEKLFIVKKDGTEVEVGKHENINDGGQEIATSKIGTSAEDFQTKNHTAVIGKTTLIDTVKYENLIPDKEYTITGTLMDKETGKAVEVDGMKITKSITFTPKERNGSVKLEFEVDSSTLEGLNTVFFEKLLYKGVELTSHEEPEDEEQKIDFPKIRTTAIDGQTENHTGVTGITTIVDTVKYENLTVGQTYVMEGIVMDKATGKELTIDGKTVTATQEFTPQTQNGTVDVTFNIDASELKGKDVVVFETLMQGKVKITEHKSINDKGQTVNYPEVRTRAINKETLNQTNTVGKTTIIDTVSYKNLTVGQEYMLEGKLVDKATGEYLKDENGNDITSGKIPFTPEQPTGQTEIPIEIDTTLLQGKKIVVFEKLYQKDIEVTAHEDVNDIPQNTEVPTLGTTATDLNTENHTGIAGETTIVDEVKYTGLTIGQKYVVKGVLMDKTTNEPVVIDGKEIVAEQEFIVGEEIEYTHPSVVKETSEKKEDETIKETKEDTKKEETKEETEEDTKEETEKTDEETEEEAYEPIEGVTSDGTVKLFYDLNAEDLKGHPVVVFETLYQIPNDEEEPVEDETPDAEKEEKNTEPVKIISHEDIEDEGQTVDIPDARTTATDINTTTHTAVVGKTTIVDEVKFTGLTVGEEYTFKGVLMDKETGEPIMQDGKEVTAEATMTAQAKDGSQLLEFPVDTELVAGRSVVAFEEVYYKDLKITDHKDLTDEDQTVNVPTIATTATGANGKTVEYGSAVTIVDTVTYTNLTVGEKYVMSGTMVDQNGNAVSNVESVPFEATSANGSVEVKFVIDTTAHAGEKLVAFEELSAENGTKITEHKDLTDEGQTVYVNTPPEEVPPTTKTTPTPSTGNNAGLMTAIGITVGAAAAGVGIALGSRKKREED